MVWFAYLECCAGLGRGHRLQGRRAAGRVRNASETAEEGVLARKAFFAAWEAQATGGFDGQLSAADLGVPADRPISISHAAWVIVVQRAELQMWRMAGRRTYVARTPWVRALRPLPLVTFEWQSFGLPSTGQRVQLMKARWCWSSRRGTPCSGMQERLKRLQAVGLDDATVMEPT